MTDDEFPDPETELAFLDFLATEWPNWRHHVGSDYWHIRRRSFLAGRPAPQALAATPAMRDALGEIASKNDLSGISDDDLASAACNALYECELIARAALAATPAVEEQINAIPRKEARELLASIPGGRGYDDRVLLAVEQAMNLEWWRGYYAAQPEYLSGCQLRGPGECQKEGKCMSASCDHFGKTTFRPRMTLEAQVDGILYSKETGNG